MTMMSQKWWSREKSWRCKSVWIPSVASISTNCSIEWCDVSTGTTSSSTKPSTCSSSKWSLRTKSCGFQSKHRVNCRNSKNLTFVHTLAPPTPWCLSFRRSKTSKRGCGWQEGTATKGHRKMCVRCSTRLKRSTWCQTRSKVHRLSLK